MSDSLWLHGLKHTRPPYPLPTSGVDSSSCLSSCWCHPTISSSAVPFSSCLQSFPASGSFLRSRTRWPAYWSFSISPSNNYSGLISYRIDWYDLLAVEEIYLDLLSEYKGLSRVFSNTTVQKHQFFRAQQFLWTNSHILIRLLEKP